MAHIDDELITNELNRGAPPIAERSPELLRHMQSMNAEARARARHRRRGRGLGIAAAIGAFAIFGTTAAVAAPAMRLLWQPDYVMTYQSELAGACTFSMLHEASVYDELGLSDEETRAAALDAIATLDLSEAGRTGMVQELLEKLDRDDPYAAHVPPHLTADYVAGLSAAALEQESVFAAFASALGGEFEFRDWRVEGRMNLVCDGVSQ